MTTFVLKPSSVEQGLPGCAFPFGAVTDSAEQAPLYNVAGVGNAGIPRP